MIHHSSVIRLVLDVSYDKALPLGLLRSAGNTAEPLQTILYAIEFVKLYKFHVALNTIENDTRTSLHEVESRMVAIIIASHIPSLTLVCDCLTLPPDVERFTQKRPSAGQNQMDIGVYNQYVTLPWAMPAPYMELCPSWFKDMMGRAHGSVPDSHSFVHVAAKIRELWPLFGVSL